MALSVGTRLGTFEITGQLGVGGMGEVYRAADTKLGREVALKTLPASLADDADRLARFEREAKLLASLNHAHIAAVHSLDEHDGTLYIAMELVEGVTLEEKLRAGALPVDDALRLGLQIAEALEAAHGKGVIHRDLKPANIMITPEGVVKVLDFGLAKAFAGNPNEASPAHSPALSLAMTQAGLVLGTAGYMSPEQASGQASDQRADIWSFGVVLYEMLTGQPLFSGESVPHILAGVLRSEPDWDCLPETVSPRLTLLLEHCLNKRVRDRYHSIADVRIDIADLLRSPENAATGLLAAPPARRSAWPITGAFVVGLVAAGLTTWVFTRPGVPELARFDITPDEGVAVTLNSASAAIAPDGRSIAYLAEEVGGGTGGRELHLRRLNELDSTVLVSSDSAQFISPFFSRDGMQIGYYTADPSGGFALRRISALGGAPSTITELTGLMRGASWGDDGTIVFATADRASGLWRVRATGGEPELLTVPDTDSEAVDHMWPEMLPGSEAVLFAIVREAEEESEIAVLSLVTGEQRVLLRGGSSPHYVPTGHLLFGRAGTLFAVPFDAERLALDGDPVPVQEGVATKGAFGATEAGVASNGSLLYMSGSQQASDGRRLVWVDTAGRETVVPTPARMYDQVILAPDETHAALRIEGDAAVWIADLERGTLQRLPESGGSGQPIVLFFSADGRRVAHSAIRDDGQAEVLWQATDGSGQTDVLAILDEPVREVRAGALTSDDRYAVLTVITDLAHDLGVVEIGDPESYRSFIATPSNDFSAEFSPDHRWAAYGSDETGTFEVYVQRFPEGGGRLPVTIGGGGFPRWSADGRALTYIGLGGLVATGMMRVSVTGLDEPQSSPVFGTPTELFSWQYYQEAHARSQFDMTADGERFLMITSDSTDNETRLILVQNWFEELSRIVPTD
jgi:hypothetical protein